MKRTVSKSILGLCLLLLVLFFAPQKAAQKLRSMAIAAFFPSTGTENSQNEEIKRLALENQLLHGEVLRLREFLEQELHLLSFGRSEEVKEIYDSHQKRILDLYKLQLASLPARVIFRPANLWNSSLWINVGEADNVGLATPIICKNSPVVLGDAVIGVIDFVGKKQSRVRLITDSMLNLSVRIARDGLFLAKGEITGQSLPLWRSREQTLIGSGFNYDFADDEGPARDLRTGEPLNAKGASIALLQENDLLITTGMDGVFPPGLKVGSITRIHPLKEGDYFYNLEAMPSAGNLQDVTLVFVLPSLGYNFEESPIP